MTKNKFTRATCDNCSAPLTITGEEKVVKCEFCSTSHVVPQNLLDAQTKKTSDSEKSMKSLNDEKNVILEARENYLSESRNQIIDFKNVREKKINAINELKSQKPKTLVRVILLGVVSLIFSCIGVGMIMTYSSGEESASVFMDILGAGFTIFLVFQFIRHIRKIRKIDQERRSLETELETLYSLDRIAELENEMAQTEEKYNQRLSKIKNELDSKIGV